MCTARHNHSHPPTFGTQLAATELNQLETIVTANPGATPSQLVRGRNPNVGATAQEGGTLTSISPALASSTRTRSAIRTIRNANNNGGDASDEYAVAQFFRDHPRNLLLSRGPSLLNPIFMHIWVTADCFNVLFGMVEAFKTYGIGSTLCADTSFKHVRRGNVISLTCYDYVIEREIPLLVAIVPDRKDTDVYFEYWSIILDAFPFLMEYNALDQRWKFSLPGMTVDFDAAQSAGFAMAVGCYILRRDGDLPPSPLEEEVVVAAYYNRAKELGRAVALDSLRPCDFHFNQAVIREARRIVNVQDRSRFESRCMSLKRIDLSVAEFDEIIEDLTNSFPLHATWLSYWTRTALARSIFPCLSTVELTVFLQRATTTSRTENLHDLYREGSAGRDSPWIVFLRHLVLIDRQFNERRQAVLQGEINYQRARPTTMERLPGRILSHGVLARNASSDQTADVVRGLPGRLSTHRSFRNLLAGIEAEFNGADDLGGLQRVEVSFLRKSQFRVSI